MGQKNCCTISQKIDYSITQEDIEKLNFEKLDFNRGSTYKKLENIATTITTQRGISTAYNILISRIIANKQEHLIKILNSIQDNELKNKFISHLETMDFELVDSTEGDQEKIYYNQYKSQININDITEELYQQYYDKGIEIIQKEQVGCVILAGGKNLRFSSSKQKSMCDIGLPSEKTIFQIISERILKIQTIAENFNNQEAYKIKVPIYIMASDENFFEIKNFWKSNKYFGLDMNQVFFFLQQTLPVLNTEGKVILKSNLKIHLAPNGPGDFFTSLQTFGLLKRIIKNKIKYLHVFGIENLMIRPLDPIFIGLQFFQNTDFLIKCVERNTIDEEQQIVLQKNEQICLMDSLQLAREMDDPMNVFSKEATNSPVFSNNFLVKVDFLNDLSTDPIRKFKLAQGFQITRRSLPYFDYDNQIMTTPLQENSYIFEKQISNLLELSQKVGILNVNREEEFAPIYYESGINSPQEAIRVISNLHKKWMDVKDYEPDNIFEISPLLSYSGEQISQLHIEEFQEKLQYITFPFHLKQYDQTQDCCQESTNQDSITYKDTQRQL